MKSTSREQQAHFRTQLPLGFDTIRTGRLSWSFSHVVGTCPDPTLLFLREIPSQRCSPTHLSYRKQQIPGTMEVEESKRRVYCHSDARAGLAPRLSFDNTARSLLPKHPSTG